MSILWRLVFFSRCTSTHHKLALDALRFVRGPNSDLWTNLFLSNHEQYLTGSKAPDNEFKDFKNHVLHVKEGFWGGATASARQWYQKTVVALSQGDWPEAIFNAGVLSHYFTDPFQPFHTGQTETEGKVHRAAEWSICKSYEDLQAILEHDLNGYPEYELTSRPDWLEEAIRQGAITAHESYDICVEHYDLNRGIKSPPSGLDQEMKDLVARLIGLAAVGFSRVLERAFEESGATPPDVAVSLHVFLAGLKMPLNWVRKKFTDLHERAVIEAIYLEAQDKGKVIEALPEDERVVRKLHAQEVLKVPVRQLDAEPASATGAQFGTGAPSRGETVKAASSAGFQRTVISKPRQFEMPYGQAEALETCLIVPLAKSAPQDFLADAAAQAYLKTAEVIPHGAPGNNRPETIDRLTSVATAPAIQSSEPAPKGTTSRPVIAPLSMPSSGELEREERRLQKRARRSHDPEPVLTPPAMPVNLARQADTSLATPEMPLEMFAPLPPMTRAASRDSNAPTATTATPPAIVPREQGSMPAVAQSTLPKAPMPTTASPAPVSHSSPSRVAPPPASPQATLPPAAKTYVAQGPAQSVIPSPHVRLPEPVEDKKPGIELTNRLTGAGQSAGAEFDFRSISGISQPTNVTQPAPPQTPDRQVFTAPKPAAIPAPLPESRTVPEFRSETATGNLAASRRFYLELSSPVVDAPSIGPKTAERFHAIGINTIADLLTADPGNTAEQLGNRAAADLVRDWQDQSRLVCAVPTLRGHDAQFLVACQVRTAEQLRLRDPRQLLQQVAAFVGTSAGQRLLRGGKPPDLTEVTEWVTAARDARPVSL